MPADEDKKLKSEPVSKEDERKCEREVWRETGSLSRRTDIPKAANLSQMGKHFATGDILQDHVQIRIILKGKKFKRGMQMRHGTKEAADTSGQRERESRRSPG